MPRYRLDGDVWMIQRVDNQLEITSGGKTSVRKFKTPEQAAVQEQKLIDEKLAAGYRAALADPRHPELEAAIAAEPDVADHYAVLGDWLQSQGDPRGQLIALQLAEQTPQVERATAKLLDEYRDYFLGPLAVHAATPVMADVPVFEWRYGYIRHVNLSDKRAEATLADVLHHPSGRFLSGITGWFASKKVQRDIGLLEVAAPRSLRRLALYAVNGLDLSRMWTAIPELRSFELVSKNLDLGTVVLPKLERFAIQDNTLRASTVRMLAKAPWPALKDLLFDFGHDETTGDASIDELEPWLARADVPITHLAVYHAQAIDELLQALPDFPIAARLERLDVSKNLLTDGAIVQFAKQRDKFPRLTIVDVSENRLTQRGVAALTEAFPTVHARYLRT